MWDCIFEEIWRLKEENVSLQSCFLWAGAHAAKGSRLDSNLRPPLQHILSVFFFQAWTRISKLNCSNKNYSSRQFLIQRIGGHIWILLRPLLGPVPYFASQTAGDFLLLETELSASFSLHWHKAVLLVSILGFCFVSLLDGEPFLSHQKQIFLSRHRD